MPGKNYSKRNRAEVKAIKKIAKQKPSVSQARGNLKMADVVGEKPRRIDKKTVKQAERQETKTKAKATKNLKSVNKKPLSPRSRSGAASGRSGVPGMRFGGGFGKTTKF